MRKKSDYKLNIYYKSNNKDMKNIQSFEQFNESQSQVVNEELFGLNKSKKRKANLQKALDKYVPVWVRKRAISDPTQEELDQFWADAEADDYETGDLSDGSGGVGNKDGKLIYRSSDAIGDRIGYSKHIFGGGA